MATDLVKILTKKLNKSIKYRVKDMDSFAPNRAASRHRPAGLSVGTKHTGAVAAPGLRASTRLPSTKLNFGIGP